MVALIQPVQKDLAIVDPGAVDANNAPKAVTTMIVNAKLTITLSFAHLLWLWYRSHVQYIGLKSQPISSTSTRHLFHSSLQDSRKRSKPKAPRKTNKKAKKNNKAKANGESTPSYENPKTTPKANAKTKENTSSPRLTLNREYTSHLRFQQDSSSLRT